MSLTFRIGIAALLVCVSYTTSGQSIYESYQERINDPYLARDAKSVRTSSAFQIRSKNFFSTQVNVDANGENIVGDAANEPSIAINPNNPLEMVIGWRQFDNIASDFRQAGFAYTIDGGRTWINNGPLEPEVFRSDPVLGVDNNGTFYYNSLSVDDLSSLSGFETDIFRSTTIGEWDEGAFAFGGDKQWMAIGQLGEGNVRVFNRWSISFSACAGDFTYSRDGGESYESCSSTGEPSYLGTMAIGPEGRLYSAGYGSNETVSILRYDDALRTTDLQVSHSSSIQHLGSFARSRAGVNPAGLLGQVEIEVNHAEGPYHGEVYVLNTADDIFRTDFSDVLFAKSSDFGETWSALKRINDDNSIIADQWFGTMSVAPNGRIDVFWLDNRENEGEPISALYYSFSMDGGETWSENERLSPFFNSRIGWPQQMKMGDYFHSLSDDGGAHIAWAGTFNGEQDVYYGYAIPNLTTSSEEETYVQELKVSVIPNPIVAQTEIKVDYDQEVFMSVYDIKGVLLSPAAYRLKEGRKNVRLNQILRNQEIASGTYFLLVEDQNGNRVVSKMLKMQ